MAGLRSGPEKLNWLRRRLVDYYWRSSHPRPMGTVLSDACRRVRYDLSVKVPAYLRGWLKGDLRGKAFQEGLALERDRGELERLVATATARRTPGNGDHVASGPAER
jgi:hypothetical protein